MLESEKIVTMWPTNDLIPLLRKGSRGVGVQPPLFNKHNVNIKSYAAPGKSEVDRMPTYVPWIFCLSPTRRHFSPGGNKMMFDCPCSRKWSWGAQLLSC